MDLLRRVLYLQAVVSAAIAVALIGFPRVLLVSALGQPSYPDYTWVRLVGIAALTLSLLLVLVGHRVEELWWWSWAFVVGSAGAAVILTLNAAFGLPPAADPWMWWGAAALAWALAATLLWGIARAGAERPVL